MNSIIDFCTECESKNIEEISRVEELDIKGEKIAVTVTYWHCKDCGWDFENLKSGNNYIATAYRIYRERHKMLQPEDIKELRKKYGLTQGELAKILGWGLATLSRYEKGALQDSAHDNMLKILKNPDNLYTLLIDYPDILDAKRYSEILKNLTTTYRINSLSDNLVKKCFSYPESTYSGFRKFDYEKFVNVILFLCKNGALKTKLNKLLFYTDFKHFKENTLGITGLKYSHDRFGPVPIYYQSLTGSLVDEGILQVNEINYGAIDCNTGSPIIGEEYKSSVEPDMTVFSLAELDTLYKVKQHFDNWGSIKISEFSHQEDGYKETEIGEEISYKYAETLSI